MSARSEGVGVWAEDLAKSDDPRAKKQAAALDAKLVAARKTVFAPNRGDQDPQSCVVAMQRWGGWWGPWIDL